MARGTAGRVACCTAVLLLALASGGRASRLDGVEFERGSRPPLSGPRKDAWERAQGGRQAAKVQLAQRLGGWPERLSVERAALPDAERSFLERLARDTWRGIDALRDRDHELPIDHVSFASGSLDPRDAEIGDYTSGTNIGLYLMALVAARELGLLSAEEASARAAHTLETVTRLEHESGLLFNYYDTTTLERTTDFVSFVDASWFAAGLVTARAGFPALASRASALLDAADFAVFHDRRLDLMLHGFFVEPLRRSPYHYGTLYTEARLGSLLAIGKGDVPSAHWSAMGRAAARRARGGAADAPGGRFERSARSGSKAWYEWDGLRYVPSWGGSMFEALMPLLVLDELRHAPASLGPNAVAHVEVQRRWARDRLDYPVWGLSPSWSPAGEFYAEYGARVLGTHGYQGGAVTPHASALALAVAPEAASANLRALAEGFELYGDFGLYDAVDPRSGAVARTYLVLDQAMTLVALANHLRGGVIQRLFESDPLVQRALPVLAGERFFAPGGAKTEPYRGGS